MHEPETATDPVCGMSVGVDSTSSVEHRGVTYRFCDPACAEMFEKDPARWVGQGTELGFVHDHH